MATVNPTLVSGASGDTVKIYSWTLTSANNDGEPIPADATSFSDRSVQAYGTFGGGTVTWEGTSDPERGNWQGLSTVASSAATFATAGIKQILESTLYARPVLTGSSGATVTVVAVCRRPFRN